MSRLAAASIDTGVIIEYVDKEGEYHGQAETVFSAILSGRLEAIIPHPVLAETYYVAARIYGELGRPTDTATRLVEWLYRLPSVRVVGIGLDLALEAGRIKQRYGIALTDSYVLAASRLHNCTALFRKPEAEMMGKIGQIRREYRVLFLKDYA